MSKEINRISLGQLYGAVLTYEDGNGETVEVKFDGCDEKDDSKKDENDIPIISTFAYKSFP